MYFKVYVSPFVQIKILLEIVGIVHVGALCSFTLIGICINRLFKNSFKNIYLKSSLREPIETGGEYAILRKGIVICRTYGYLD